MITEIGIENFKAFAKTARIPLKPITLLFGPNSSGKSSLIQAILMLRQTIEESMSDEQTLLPKGKLVDLGNFSEFIHNHNESLSFSLTFKISPPIGLYDAIPTEDYISQTKGGSDRLNNLCDSIESLPLGIKITFSFENTKGIHVTQVDLLVGEDPTSIITYVNEPPESMESLPDDADEKAKKLRESQWRIYRTSPKRYMKFKKIEDHEYWKKYFKHIKEDEWWRQWKDEFDLLSEEYPEIDWNSTSTLTKEEKILARKMVKERQIRFLKCLMKTTRVLFANDYLVLSKFMPVGLNGYDPQYLTSCDFDLPDQDNISVLILASSYRVKEYLLNCIHLGPVRQNPERKFFFSGIISAYVGEHGQYTNEILVTNPDLVKKVNKQLSSLNLGYQVKIVQLASDSSDVKISTIRLVNDSGIDLAVTDVGYGISQVLPIIAQSMLAEGKTIFIEQPELHLHPAQQAELGSFFAYCIRPENTKDANNTDGAEKPLPNRFIIETHSENIILRLQKLIRKGELKKEDLAVIYFDKTAKGTEAKELRLNDDGEFIDPWPHGFFEESFKEMFGD